MASQPSTAPQPSAGQTGTNVTQAVVFICKDPYSHVSAGPAQSALHLVRAEANHAVDVAGLSVAAFVACAGVVFILLWWCWRKTRTGAQSAFLPVILFGTVHPELTLLRCTRRPKDAAAAGRRPARTIRQEAGPAAGRDHKPRRRRRVWQKGVEILPCTSHACSQRRGGGA